MFAIVLIQSAYKIQNTKCTYVFASALEKKACKITIGRKKFRLNPTQVGTSREFFFFLEVASYLYNYNFPSCAVVRFGIAEFRLRFRRLLRCVDNSKRRAERHD